MKTLTLLFVSCLSSVLLKADSVAFPAGLIPFHSIAAQTEKDSAGDMLVLGYTKLTLQAALASVPLPSSPSESFSNAFVELAPGVFFSDVFLPTAAQRDGNYSDFSQPLINPYTGKAFPSNIIPADLLFLNGVFAFEVGPQATATPEPSVSSLLLGGFALGALCIKKRRFGKN